MSWWVLAAVIVVFLVLPAVLLRMPRMRVRGARGKQDRPPGVVPTMGELTMYSTSWCGYCRRLKMQLNDAGIDYTEIDIESDAEAAAFVESVNRGNQVVPTVVFADGSAATNPSLAEVQQRIAA
jgi:mycoredoxin